jgi:O-antigen ligase
VLYTGATLWVCYVGAQARRAPAILLTVVAIAAAAVAVVALRDFSIGRERYLSGLHGGPGDHSCALLTLMPCVMMALWHGRQAGWSARRLALGAALVLLLLASAYTTLNRTIWLGFAAQLALIGAFLLLRRRAPWSIRAKVFSATFVLVTIFGTGTMILNIQAQRDAIGVARNFDRDARLELWPEVIERVAERPVTGYGFGRGLLRESLREELGAVDPFLWHAHNVFLEALLQLGVPGLLLFLLLLGAILREASRLARDADSLRAACGLALFGVVAGMVVRNTTDSLFLRQNALLFWGAVGVLLMLGSRRPAA